MPRRGPGARPQRNPFEPGDVIVGQLVHHARAERLRGAELREFILHQRGIHGPDTAIATLLALVDHYAGQP